MSEHIIDAQHLTGIALDTVELTALRFRKGDLTPESAKSKWVGIVHSMKLQVRVSPPEPVDSCDVFLAFDFDMAESWELFAEVRGRFRIPAGRFTAPALSLGEFARQHAVVILMPFVRQAIAQSTESSELGPFLLPPINVAALLREPKAASEGRAVKRG